MKVKIYYDPFTKKSFNQEAEILLTVPIAKNLKINSNNSQIAAFNLWHSYGLKKAFVKYSDGTIDDVVFDPNDIVSEI